MVNCHTPGGTAVAVKGRKIALVGNPNVGKSVVFGNLTGVYAEVSNFPGTTIGVHQGKLGEDAVYDTPGTYSIASFNEEERVARSLVIEADLIVNVVGAPHLERDLFLTLQLLDLGIPMIVVLNMMDDARSQGVHVDVEGLSRELGVPVLPAVAVKRQGMDDIRSGLDEARSVPLHPGLESRIRDAGLEGLPRAEAVLLLEGDPETARARGVEPLPYRDAIYRWRRARVDALVAGVVTRTHVGASLRARVGYWMMHPVTGLPLLAVTLFAMYEVLGVLVAGRVVAFTEGVVGKELWVPFVQGLVQRLFAPGSVMETILTGEYGLLTMTFTYMFGVILPLVIGFYLLLAVLEDSGYLPRIAVLLDNALQRVGLNGRAVIPMILGLGCVTMATMSTRVLNSKRERMIATFLLALAIPCSAQLGVIMGILAAIGAGWYALAFVGIIFSVFVVAGTALSRLIPGQSTDLLLDIPPLRVPRLDNVLKKTFSKAWLFAKEVTLFFAIGALLLSVLQLTGALTGIQSALAPLTEDWLHMPREAATAFVMGFVRRDFGAAGLYQLPLTQMQSLAALVTITLFVPCIASVLVIMKERGTRYLVAAWGTSVVAAFLVAGIVTRIGELVTG